MSALCARTAYAWGFLEKRGHEIFNKGRRCRRTPSLDQHNRCRSLKGAGAAVGLGALGMNLFSARRAMAADPPTEAGRPGMRYVIRGGSVMSMDPKVGDFAKADVLVEGGKIVAVGPDLGAGGGFEIDATGRIVMPGFIDTHHHQFETALRSWLADGVLINDGSGSPSGSRTYYENILLKFATVYRPQDVYINELFAGLSQLDDGVTTVGPGVEYTGLDGLAMPIRRMHFESSGSGSRPQTSSST